MSMYKQVRKKSTKQACISDHDLVHPLLVFRLVLPPIPESTSRTFSINCGKIVIARGLGKSESQYRQKNPKIFRLGKEGIFT